MHQRFHTEVSGSGVLENALDDRPVAKPYGRTGRVDDELAGEIACDLRLVVEQQLLQFADVTEFASVRQRAARIHRLRRMEDEGLSVFAEAGRWFTFAERT